MANFKKSYRKLEAFEGLYSNDSRDPGGETFKGISRKYWPLWEGWSIIDIFKRNDKFSLESLLNNSYLLLLTERFYKINFWDVFDLDNIKSQDIANELFETAVNLGISATTKYLQKGLNILNRNERLFRNLIVDGKFGDNTKNAMELIEKEKDSIYLFNILNIYQGNHYLKTENNIFIRGWLKRVKIKKK